MINLIRNLFKKKSEPKFAKCLNSQTWLERQVDDALYKRDMLNHFTGNNLPNNGKDAGFILKPSDNWYDKYYDNE
tara:strand:- start:140 stop:364 length:225 start_codon:yes stop_codon:yes gene_type:complete